MARQYWILKSEPSEYSFDDLVRDGRTRWDGIRNALALKHLRSMATGDEILFYHTGGVRAAVGIARVLKAPYADPDGDGTRDVVVDIGPVRALARPVTLAAIKQDPAFRDLALVRMGRLSVVPVTPAQWKRLLAMGTTPTP